MVIRFADFALVLWIMYWKRLLDYNENRVMPTNCPPMKNNIHLFSKQNPKAKLANSCSKGWQTVFSQLVCIIQDGCQYQLVIFSTFLNTIQSCEQLVTNCLLVDNRPVFSSTFVNTSCILLYLFKTKDICLTWWQDGALR